mgnify:CR=1 FL=1
MSTEQINKAKPSFTTHDAVAAAVQIALSKVGEKEEPAGSNDSPFIRECLASVNLQPKQPWCMAFMYWCFSKAWQQCGLSAMPVPRTGHVLTCWNKTPIARRVMAKSANRANVKAGAQFFMDFGSNKGHTGILLEWVDAYKFKTIEGNTDASGSRTGGQVMIRTRDTREPKMLGFANWM